jgi:hypothetical protein
VQNMIIERTSLRKPAKRSEISTAQIDYIIDRHIMGYD